MKQYFATYKRHPKSIFLRAVVTFAAALTIFILFSLVAYIIVKGIPNLKPSLFEWEYTSENASMMPALINTVAMVLLTLLLAVPFGIGSAIYLTEYAKRDNKVVPVIRMTTETLSGIPSIVYGLFGYMALTDKLAGDYRSQRRYSADKKRYPSGLVSDKTPTSFYGSGGKQFLRCRGLRRWVQKNNLLVEL